MRKLELGQTLQSRRILISLKILYNQSWAVFKYIVFKYIYCIYTLYLNTFFNLYLITVFKYFWSVFKYMYLNTCI